MVSALEARLLESSTMMAALAAYSYFMIASLCFKRKSLMLLTLMASSHKVKSWKMLSTSFNFAINGDAIVIVKRGELAQL